MLASRVLPPIVRPSSPSPPSPVATFFNVPRRYVRSNMQVGDTPQVSPIDDVKRSRSLRKSNRLHDTKATPTSSPVHRAKDGEIPSAAVTSSRPPRKRLAPIENTVAGEDQTESQPQLAQVKFLSTSAFVSLNLRYRVPEMHHQQAIIASNPGLNNPDISKIIGEQWKAESEDSKKVWQDLAQEEKARHHEQYPDYRYQPRRVGKSASSPLNPSVQHTTIDKYRCARCGGRSIKTPTSPYPESIGTPTLPPPNFTEGSTPTTRYLPVMTSLSLESPVRRRGHGPSGLSNIQVPPIREETSSYSPLTPGAKKRRFDYGPSPSTGRRPDGPYYPQYSRRDSLPPMQIRYSPPNSATMPPPRTPRDTRRLSMAEGNPHPDHSSKSVEEVLMNFPYQNKIKLLGRISLPHKEPSPSGLAHTCRGAIIAVEGDDIGAVKELSQWLNERLAKDSDSQYRPRIAEPPKAPNEQDVTFEDYLDLIKVWHGKSKEMIQYITTPVSLLSSVQDLVMVDKESEQGSERAPSDTDRKDSATSSNSSVPVGAVSASCTETPTAKPIIILPTFQLAASVAYASRIPIQDAYSCTDHWQWMATLWRGTVGPDLTIYVKLHEKDTGFSKPEMDETNRCLTIGRERDGKFTDADLRRLGFEVSEFINCMSNKAV
ncbi:slightly ste11-like protein [Pleosporales sp. CAS-2024a]